MVRVVRAPKRSGRKSASAFCPAKGHSTASVTWPGYVMTVTGVSEKGVAVFLHVANARRTLTPRRDSLPTAVAARAILEGADVEGGFELAAGLLEQTSPPAGYLTRVVLPEVPEGEPGPVKVFEADYQNVAVRSAERLCVVTNHFLRAKAPRGAGRDSSGRYDKLENCLVTYLEEQDRRVSTAETWEALALVQRSGRRFATLHSIVFRQQPWVLEVAIGTLGPNGRVLGAAKSQRRYRLQREGVFPREPR